MHCPTSLGPPPSHLLACGRFCGAGAAGGSGGGGGDGAGGLPAIAIGPHAENVKFHKGHQKNLRTGKKRKVRKVAEHEHTEVCRPRLWRPPRRPESSRGVACTTCGDQAVAGFALP